MRAHSQTIDQRPRVGVAVSVGDVDWLHRLYQWFRNVSRRQRQIGPVSPYGTWDAQRERYRPMRAEAAIDLIVSQKGMAWCERIYNASI